MRHPFAGLVALLIPFTLGISECTPTEEGNITVRAIHASNGQPVSGIEVFLGQSMEQSARTDSNGVVVFEGVTEPMSITTASRLVAERPDSTWLHDYSTLHSWVGVAPGSVIEASVYGWGDDQSDVISGHLFGVALDEEDSGLCVGSLSQGATRSVELLPESDPMAFEIAASDTQPITLLGIQAPLPQIERYGCSAMPVALAFDTSPEWSGEKLELDIPFNRENTLTFTGADSRVNASWPDLQITPPGGEVLYFTEDEQPLTEDGTAVLHSPQSLRAFGEGAKLTFRAVLSGPNMYQATVQALEHPSDLHADLSPVPVVDQDVNKLYSGDPVGVTITTADAEDAAVISSYFIWYSYDFDTGVKQRTYWRIYDADGQGGAEATYPMVPNAYLPVDGDVLYAGYDTAAYYGDNSSLDVWSSGQGALPETYNLSAVGAIYDVSPTSGEGTSRPMAMGPSKPLGFGKTFMGRGPLDLL